MNRSIEDEITKLLEEGFPEPPEKDLHIDESGPNEKSYQAAMAAIAHLAVNVNDKQHRETMLYLVESRLLSGGSLAIAERAWLLYVLSKLDDMPHESKGHPIQGNARIELMLSLIGFLLKDEIESPKSKVTHRLERASQALAKSYEALRAVYYSNGFKQLRQNLADRGNIPRVLNRMKE